jgi:hypothetical protein
VVMKHGLWLLLGWTGYRHYQHGYFLHCGVVETAHVSYWLGAQVWLSTLSELVYPVVAFVSTLTYGSKTQSSSLC